MANREMGYATYSSIGPHVAQRDESTRARTWLLKTVWASDRSQSNPPSIARTSLVGTATASLGHASDAANIRVKSHEDARGQWLT